MMKKIVTWGGLAFLVFFIAYQPDAAAGVAGKLGDTIGEVLSGMGDFLAGVVG
ncbi:MAG: hypothetical protein H0T78_10435 [Longispora sp.]|nr:hypothetical protein [Longispora sp. (in: high G+C Gram-positive bacteria)]